MDNTVGVPANDHGSRPVPSVIDVIFPVERLSIVLIKFNRLGTLIAAGAVNGYVALIDFTTKRTANLWNAHVLGVTSISWSRDGATLCTTSLDNTYAISDVASGSVIKTVMMGPGLIGMMLNPRNNEHVLFNTSSGIKLVDMPSKSSSKLEVFKPDDAISSLIFDRKGKHVIAGTSKGFILIYNLSGKIIKSGAIDTSQTIRTLCTTKKLNLVIVTAADRFIRVYDYNEFYSGNEIFDTENRLSDHSNKTVWQAACSSGEGEYVAGMCATSHMVTIFERVTGAIVAQLCESKNEIPLSFDWHPAQPAVASVCNGHIFIWKQKPRPSWAAYAPHFTELGENMQYIEKESEFDQFDEDILEDDGARRNIAEDLIDVDTCRAPSPLCSSDDEDPNAIGTAVAVANTEQVTTKMFSCRPRFPVTLMMNPRRACDAPYRRSGFRRISPDSSDVNDSDDEAEDERESAKEDDNNYSDNYNNVNGFHTNGGTVYMNGFASYLQNGHSSRFEEHRERKRKRRKHKRREKRKRRKRRRRHHSAASSSSERKKRRRHSSPLLSSPEKQPKSPPPTANGDDRLSPALSLDPASPSTDNDRPTLEIWDGVDVSPASAEIPIENARSPNHDKPLSRVSDISDTPLVKSRSPSPISDDSIAHPLPPVIPQSPASDHLSDVSNDSTADWGQAKKRRMPRSSSNSPVKHGWDSE